MTGELTQYQRPPENTKGKGRRLLTYLLFLAFGLTLAEVGARWWLGFGTPPLLIEHPEIDYMFAPNQDVNRFGNRQLFNSYGMRSASLDQVGTRELVLVFGDSVLNGGNLTDHEELATTLANNDDLFFGNVSAGSWGPGNYRAWINHFGLLAADSSIFVLSDHDLNDQPTFESLNPVTHPTQKPLTALTEVITRYLTRYLPEVLANFIAMSATGQREGLVQTIQPTGLDDMQEVFHYLAANRVRSCILFHPTNSELTGEDRPGMAVFQKLADELGIPTMDLAKLYRSRENPSRLYRDNIHINAYGQKLLAEGLSRCNQLALVPRVPDRL